LRKKLVILFVNNIELDDIIKKQISFELKEVTSVNDNSFYQLKKPYNNTTTYKTNQNQVKQMDGDSDLVKKCVKCKKVRFQFLTAII